VKICMVLHDPQPFGGLEEYAVSLAVGLRKTGQDVSVLSTTWVPKDNQYVHRLLENGVTYIQVPKWLSLPASNWTTKQRILKVILWIVTPLTILLAIGLSFARRINLHQAWTSAYGWLRGQIQRYIAPNRYQSLTRLLLAWWRLRWMPNVLHVQGYTTNLLFVIDWAYDKKIPVVYEEHQTPDAQFDWWEGFHHSINKATTVVAVSEKSAQGLRDVCKVTRPIVVRNPLLPDPQDYGWKNNGHENPDGTLHITTVARLVVAKGLEYLLEAIPLVLQIHPNARFRVYGDGPLHDELISYASKLGLNGREVFAGSFSGRDELATIMAETDIFVMSSILEGQPLGVVEAMAYGRPIVTTTVGGIPELIKDGVNGLLCPSRSPECLAKKIIQLIGDPVLRTRLGQDARRSYEAGSFQPDAVSDFFLDVYEDSSGVLSTNLP